MHSSVFSTWVLHRDKKDRQHSHCCNSPIWHLWWPPLCYISLWPCNTDQLARAILSRFHHLGFIISPLQATFSLPPAFNPTRRMPTFASPESEEDSKCKLSPLGWEQPTDSSQPLWRTQGCLCKCQSHAALSAVLHMLCSACCASTARWKTHRKSGVQQNDKSVAISPQFYCHESP